MTDEDTCPNCGNDYHQHKTAESQWQADYIGSQQFCLTQTGLYVHAYEQFEK